MKNWRVRRFLPIGKLEVQKILMTSDHRHWTPVIRIYPVNINKVKHNCTIVDISRTYAIEYYHVPSVHAQLIPVYEYLPKHYVSFIRTGDILQKLYPNKYTKLISSSIYDVWLSILSHNQNEMLTNTTSLLIGFNFDTYLLFA